MNRKPPESSIHRNRRAQSHRNHSFFSSLLGQLRQTQYYACSGQPSYKRDQNDINNGRNGTTYTYDALERVTVTAFPDGGQTNVSYLSSTQTLTQQRVQGSNWTSKYAEVDELGRPSREAVWNAQASNPWDESVTCYDSVGRVSYKAYPFQDGGWSYAKTCTSAGDHFYYDSLDRPVQSQHSDGSTIDTSYWGRAVSVTSESNGTVRPQKLFQTDGLGRLRNVCEVTSTALTGPGGTPSACGLDIAATGFLSSYDYNLLDHVTAVHQAGLADRTFSYDSLSELTSSSNPESGWINYYYDNDGNVTQRTRPAPNNTAGNINTYYSFDVLHRPTWTTYSDGTTPSLQRIYDETSPWGHSGVWNTIGHMTTAQVFVPGSGTPFAGDIFYQFDNMGRVQANGKCTPRTCGWGGYDLGYSYDYLGNAVSASNGVGVTVYTNESVAGRPLSVTSSWSDATHPGTLLSNMHYGASGIDSLNVNGGSVGENRYYSVRGQLNAIYDWGVYSATMGLAADGTITSSSDSVNSSWSYQYDQFNRLTAAVAADGRGCTESYDRFGNRWSQNNGSGTCYTSFLTFWSGTNRIDGWNYDAIGNLIWDGSHSYVYDGENRLISVDGGSTATYRYDAFGRRIKRTGGGSNLEYIYDLKDRSVAHLDAGTGSWIRGEVYGGGRHVATYVGGTTYFVWSDWLDNERLRTDISNATYSTWPSYPFGEGSSAEAPSATHFIGRERDLETGLDNLRHRYFEPTIGRFVSADPSMVVARSLDNPQRLNLYLYARDNPIGYLDPNGLDDYLYDQTGKEIDHKKYGFWHNLIIGNHYTLQADNGGRYTLDGPLKALKGGARYTIVSPQVTSARMTTFVMGETRKVVGMTFVQFGLASPTDHELDFKRFLQAEFGPHALYALPDGSAHLQDYIGNMTWGYLAAATAIPAPVAHGGAGFAQVVLDRDSKWSWYSTLGDDPRDWNAISKGYEWFGTGKFAVPKD